MPDVPSEKIPAQGSLGAEKKSGACLYCGNNPTPHFLAWYFESLDILLQPLRKGIFYNPLSRTLRRSLKKLSFGWHVAQGLLKIGFLKRQNDIGNCKVRRAQVLWEEANKRGIKFYGLKLFGKNLDMYIAQDCGLRIADSEERPQLKIFIDGLPRPLNYDSSVMDILDDKAILKKKLSAVNLPVPKGGSASSAREALKIFRKIQNDAKSAIRNPQFQNNIPVIVKPRTGSRGRHTTTYIYSEADLIKAVKIAKQLCHWVIVEEQLMGPVYRATVINHKLAGVLRGDAPQIIGDGRNNISQLIGLKNFAPHPGVKDIVPDDAMKIFLERELGIKNQEPRTKNPSRLGLAFKRDEADQQNSKFQIPNFEGGNILEHIPIQGEMVNLSEKIGVNYGGSSSEDYEICHEENKELFIRAANALGDPLVGFDFIIPDIARSWREQKCGFIEVNTLPFINLHHDPLHGTPRNAAALVWDMMGM